MSCSEFIKHQKRSTDLFNATLKTQIPYTQRRKKNYVTNPAQKGKLKQLVLTDSKNIFT